MGKQAAPIARIDRHIDRAKARQRQQVQDRDRPVRHPAEHEVSLSDAQALKRTGMPANPGVQIPPGPFRSVDKEESRFIRTRLGPVVQHVRQQRFAVHHVEKFPLKRTSEPAHPVPDERLNDRQSNPNSCPINALRSQLYGHSNRDLSPVGAILNSAPSLLPCCPSDILSYHPSRGDRSAPLLWSQDCGSRSARRQSRIRKGSK